MRKRAKRTSRVRRATTPVRPPKKKVRRTHVQPTAQNPVEEEFAVQNTVDCKLPFKSKRNSFTMFPMLKCK